MELTHFNDQGRARMVDVTEKPPTVRTAQAEGRVRMSAETAGRIRSGGLAQGCWRWPRGRASWPPSGRTSSSPCATAWR